MDFELFFGPKTMPKIEPKWPQNRPQCVPGRRLASWLHPVIFGHAILTRFDTKMAPKMISKWPKNDPVEPPMVPRTIKISNFPPKGRFGGRPGSSCHFRRTHLTSFWALLALFSQICCLCFEFFLKFSEELGWGGGGEHNFQNNDTSQHHIFLQHQNLWLARCGIALQLGCIDIYCIL